MPRRPKSATRHNRYATLIQQQLRELAVFTATQRRHRLRNIGEGVERAGARQAAHAGQGVESLHDESCRALNDSFIFATHV